MAAEHDWELYTATLPYFENITDMPFTELTKMLCAGFDNGSWGRTTMGMGDRP